MVEFGCLEKRLRNLGSRLTNLTQAIGAAGALSLAMLVAPPHAFSDEKNGESEASKGLLERIFFVRNGYPSRDVHFSDPYFKKVDKYDTIDLDERDISFSADGRVASFISGWRVYVTDSSWKDPKPVTPEGMITSDAVISPDGTKVAFSRERELYVINTDGTGSKRITSYKKKHGGDGEPCWNPEGTKIAFCRATSLDTNIYVVKSDGSNTENPEQVTWNYRAHHPAWSPNGKWIAFRATSTNEYVKRDAQGNPCKDKNGNPVRVKVETHDIFLTGADGDDWREPTNSFADLNFWYIGNISWSPDSTKLLFDAHRKNNSFERIYRLDLEESDHEKNIIDTGIDGIGPVWTYVPRSTIERVVEGRDE